ncbi:hypothetical protein MZM54_32260 [[Brevibacterium] frigoritolerans]|nr:hypothetical protein [Peribacillus frigoritolerans]
MSCAVFLVFMFKNQENMTLKKYGFIFYLIYRWIIFSSTFIFLDIPILIER